MAEKKEKQKNKKTIKVQVRDLKVRKDPKGGTPPGPPDRRPPG
jgi:hypothetical protein